MSRSPAMWLESGDPRLPPALFSGEVGTLASHLIPLVVASSFVK